MRYFFVYNGGYLDVFLLDFFQKILHCKLTFGPSEGITLAIVLQ